ncbi:MAG: ankyrin repeat domain-containing protein [Legionellales bacterium]|jgi:ankyrin repeat protein
MIEENYKKLSAALETENESERNRLLAKIDPYEVSKSGHTLLFHAVYYNNILATTWLLEKYRSKNPQLINLLNKNEQKSPLDIAIIFQLNVMTQLLLDAGADTASIKNTAKFSLLGQQGNQNTIEHLVANWTPATAALLKECLEQALRSAAQYGQLALVSFLCEQKIDINAVDRYENSALMLAARHGQKNIVEKLLTYKTTPQNIERAFVHAGAYAIEKIQQTANQQSDTQVDPYEVMGVLYLQKPDINSVDEFGDTIFIKGANCPEFLKKILSSKKHKDKININYENKTSGKTALFAAAENKNILAINILLEYGANIKQVNEQGETLIMKAVEHTNLEFVQNVMAIPGLEYDPNALLSLTIFFRKFSIAQFLLNKHQYTFKQYWACLITLSHIVSYPQISHDIEQLALRLLSGCIQDKNYDPNDIQDELPALIKKAVENQHMLLLCQLLVLQDKPHLLTLNGLIIDALNTQEYKLANKLIYLMVEVGEPTFCHLRSWQDVIQRNHPFSIPYLSEILIARSYLKVLLAKPADKINENFINAAKPYEEYIVDELLKQNDTIIESSIAIIENRYANGLSKFLHTMNPEPSESKDDSFNRIQDKIEKTKPTKMQSLTVSDEKNIAMRYLKDFQNLKSEQMTPQLIQDAEPYRELIVEIALQTPEADVLAEYIRKTENKYAHGLSRFLHSPASSSATWSGVNSRSSTINKHIELIQQGIIARQDPVESNQFNVDAQLVQNTKYRFNQ